jgi:hypothetical protein
MRVDKRTHNRYMNIPVFRETNRLTAQPFDSSSEGQMMPFDLLCISFSCSQFFGRDFVVISIIIVRINRSDIERFQEAEKLIQVFMFASSEGVGDRNIGRMVNCPPQSYLMFFVVKETPHPIHFKFQFVCIINGTNAFAH